jgi:hypothetical protein
MKDPAESLGGLTEYLSLQLLKTRRGDCFFKNSNAKIQATLKIKEI